MVKYKEHGHGQPAGQHRITGDHHDLIRSCDDGCPGDRYRSGGHDCGHFAGPGGQAGFPALVGTRLCHGRVGPQRL